MIKENGKIKFTNYDFLNLLVATVVLSGRVPILDNRELQDDLYEFVDDPKFSFLFEDIWQDEKGSESNYIDLNNAFVNAYSIGTLSFVNNNGNVQSIINLSKEQAKEYILQFQLSYTEAMRKLVSQIYDYKKNNSNYVLVRR